MSDNFRKYIKKEHYPVQPANIKFKTSFKNCILESLKRRTWKESDHETDWDIFWTEKEWIHEVMDHMHLAPNQRVNHFRNYYELCRKDNLIKNLKRYKRALEKEGKLDEAAAYNFYPTTYNLPTEYAIFCEEFKKDSKNNVWIMKPIGRSQGKGIFLFNKLSQVSQWKDSRWKQDGPSVENYIVQRYINNPLLIGGKKFDMRIYCLVTSYSPLVAYLYRDGFARFTHHRYDSEDISNTFVHLTNVAIQKTSENYDEKLGGKWDLRTLKLYLVSKYGQDAVSECFANIQQVIIRSLQSVQKVMINDKHCFELYGFDVLLDDQLKPWLIEVNGSPSMTANTTHDFELKCNLLDDVFTIIDMEKVLTGQEEQIGGFDLICKGTPIRNDSSLFSSMLSCHNNRSQQLKKLAKIISSRLAQIAAQEKEEAKKNSSHKDKDIPSLSTTDSNSNGSRPKPRVAPKAISTNLVPKQTRTTLPPRQNTMVIPKEPKEPKEIASATRAVRTKPADNPKARTPISSSTTNPPTTFSTSVPGGGNAVSPTVSSNGNGVINSPGFNNVSASPSYHKVATSVSNALTMISNTGAGSTLLAKQPQPAQSQADRSGTGKMPSTFQLAAGASLNMNLGQSFEMRTKGRTVTDMPEISSLKQQPTRTIEQNSRSYMKNDAFRKASDDTPETSNYKDAPKKKYTPDLSAENCLTSEDYE